MGDLGMYREGPRERQFSQHDQSWAVLCGLCGEEVREDTWSLSNAQTIVTIDEKTAQQQILMHAQADDVIPVSFSTAFEYYRACEVAGCYGLTMDNLYRWKKLLDQHCTTCPEEPVNARSECHGWSALPIYEFIRTIAGIRTADTGDDSVIIQPHLQTLLRYMQSGETAFTLAAGKVVTPQGLITFNYRYESNQIQKDNTNTRLGRGRPYDVWYSSHYDKFSLWEICVN